MEAPEPASALGAAPQVQPPLLEPPLKEMAPPVEPECTELAPVPANSTDIEEGEFEERTLAERTVVLPDHLKQIPFRVELRVPLVRFTLRDLQDLDTGALLMTEHLSVRDLVLTAAGERLLLVELESVEQQLTARVKRLAWRHKWRRKA